MDKPVVAVIGANGFIGNRIVEMLHLGGKHEVRPIVRRASGLALASRFDIEGKIADGFDTGAMTEALWGCDVVVHALAGDRRTIVGTVATAYEAAERAGCRRMIYLSSAMVHGQAPAANTDEHSPLVRRQAIHYNVSKVIAEAQLFARRKVGKVETVALRPGIVYGPRSQWIGALADDILASKAYLIDGGTGLCNAIYVDNLVESIIRCFELPEADGEAFLVGENETPHWYQIYERIAAALGRSMSDIPHLSFEKRSPTVMERLDQLRQSRPIKAVTRSMPRFLSDGLGAFWAASGALPTSNSAGPSPTLEMALLHTSHHVPSWQKARTTLGYAPTVNVEEAWRRTIAWLAFAGYPVVAVQDG